MKFFQTFLFGLLAGAMVCVGLLYQEYKERLHSPCLPPLAYSIGAVDPRFGISEEKFTRLALESENLWEVALDRDILQYDPHAPFTLNLVFDERQSKTLTGKELEQSIADNTSSYEELSNQIERLNISYQSLVSEHNALSAKYEKEVQKYEEEVRMWNKRGGAPEKEYQKLLDDQKALDKMRSEINALVDTINATAHSSESVVQTINTTVDTLNTNISTYNNLFGEEREFDKGLYTVDAITVYQMETLADLRMTLVHEFGHALGIQDHVDNPQSIMHYLMRDQNMSPLTLTPADIAAVTTACRFDTAPSFSDVLQWKNLLF